VSRREQERRIEKKRMRDESEDGEEEGEI